MKLDTLLRNNKRLIAIVFFVIALAISYCYFFLKVTVTGGTAASLVGIGFYSIVLFILFVFFALKKPFSYETLTAIMLFCVGLIFIVSWGPFKAADEPGHYLASYRYSNILLGLNGFEETIPIREDDKSFFLYWENDTRSPQNDSSELREQFSLFCKNPSMVSFKPDYSFSTNKRPPQMHIIPAIGLSLGRIMNLGAIPTYYLARLFSLVVFSLISFLILRLLPNYKLPVTLLLFLPITLELATSVSYDTPIIETSFLLFALCLHAIQKQTPFPIWYFLSIAILVFLLAPMKTIYLLVAVFTLFIPSACFKSVKTARVFRLCIVGIIITSFFMVSMPSVSSVAASTGASFNSSGYADTEGYAPSYTMAMVLEDPAHAINLLASTFFDNSSRHLQGLFGGLLSWTNIVGPWYIVIAFFTLFFLSLYSERANKLATPSLRLLFLVLFIMGCLAIYVSMMIGWISIKETVIVGIQGRYFIPLMPLLIVALTGLNHANNPLSENVFLGALLYINLYYCGWILAQIAIS